MNNIEKLEKVTQMYRTYVHMMHGQHAESHDLQDGEILQIPKGDGNNARQSDNKKAKEC